MAVSPAEFREGLKTLNALVSEPLSEQTMDAVVTYIDHDKDGFISYQVRPCGPHEREPDTRGSQPLAKCQTTPEMVRQAGGHGKEANQKPLFIVAILDLFQIRWVVESFH